MVSLHDVVAHAGHECVFPLDYSAVDNVAAVAAVGGAGGDDDAAGNHTDPTRHQHPPYHDYYCHHHHHNTWEHAPPTPPLVPHLRIFHPPIPLDSNSNYPMS